jgi:hypothetical protein
MAWFLNSKSQILSFPCKNAANCAVPPINCGIDVPPSPISQPTLVDYTPADKRKPAALDWKASGQCVLLSVIKHKYRKEER